MDGEELDDKRYIICQRCWSLQFRSVIRITTKADILNDSKEQGRIESILMEAPQA